MVPQARFDTEKSMIKSSSKGTALVIGASAGLGGKPADAQRFAHSVPAARYRVDTPAQQPT
jgi:hypothetical protein